MDKLITALGPNDPDDGEQGRQQRGLAIAVLEQNIRPDKFGYKVPSQSGNGVYLVDLEHGPYCTCPDFEKRVRACKHVFAVKALLQRGEQLDDPKPEALVKRVTQPWAAYNAAQVNEGDLFATLLRDLCDTVPQPPQANGRPRLPLSDMLYGMGLKVYSTLSTRRAMSEIRGADSYRTFHKAGVRRNRLSLLTLSTRASWGCGCELALSGGRTAAASPLTQLPSAPSA